MLGDQSFPPRVFKAMISNVSREVSPYYGTLG